jgi:hypothetical protein
MDYSAAFRRFVAESLECRIAVNVVVYDERRHASCAYCP